MNNHGPQCNSPVESEKVITIAGIGKALVILIWAALTSIILFKTAVIANSKYYERWPLQGDTISYWSRDISLSRVPLPEQASHTQLKQALNAAKLNGKDPIRTAFYGLLPADAPSSLNGHLYFSAVTVFIFFLLFMTALHRRTGSLVYALGTPFVALLPSGLFNPMYGLPSRLPDLPASLLLGAALFAMFAAKKLKKSELTWIFIAGLLLGLATLTRFQLWMYGLFIIGPISFLFGLRRYIAGDGNVKDIVIYPGVLVLGLSVVAGQFIWAWTTEMLRFYSIAGYSLNVSIATSLLTTGKDFLKYMGIPVFLAGTLIFAFYISLCRRDIAKIDRWDAGVVLWAFLSYPILLFIVMRVESIIEQSYYIVPALLLLFIAPFIRKECGNASKEFNIYSGILLLVLPLAVFGNVYSYLESESFIYPREDKVAQARFQHKLSELVAASIQASPSGHIATIDSNFFYYSRFIELLVKSRFNRDGKSKMTFQIRQSQWKLSFTGEEEKDKLLIMKALAENVDVFMALTKPIVEMKMSTFVDDYTERLAIHVNKELESNPAVWMKRGVTSGPYGEVTVYTNFDRQRLRQVNKAKESQ